MISLDLLGARIAVHASEATVERAVARLWSPMMVDVGGSGGAPPAVSAFFDTSVAPARLVIDGAVKETSDGVASLLTAFATAVNGMAIEACADFAVHAAVLSTGKSAVALPASSGVGKSTLTAAALRRGLGYVSDEALCVSYDDGLVTPYPRPIALSGWSAQSVGLAVDDDGQPEVVTSPTAFTDFVETRRLPLSDVVLLRRDNDIEAAELRPVHRAEAAEELLRLSFNHFRRAADTFALIARLLPTIRTWRLRYRDANEAAAVLADRFLAA